MPWYVCIAYFFGGAFLANSLPHLIAGITGQQLQTPFASPPFRGLSSPSVNVGWALFNLAVAYFLLVRVDPIDLRVWFHAVVAFAGFAAMALKCASALGRLRNTPVT